MDLQTSDSRATKLVETPSKPAGDPQRQASNVGAGVDAEGKKKKRKKNNFKNKKRKDGKIHIRLPSTEAYQKDICFPAEAPGRVVVRLERLMGSDKIKPVDGKYMETLIQRLEEEEILAWDRKIRLRKKAEWERHRQLAINGLMEPGPGMEDLYNHPVFRINRIFNRLSKLDTSFGHQSLRMPSIENIDPFESNDSGSFFKEYPFHKHLKEQWEKYRDSGLPPKRSRKFEAEELLEEEEEEEEDEEEAEQKSTTDMSSKPSKSKPPSKPPSKKATKIDIPEEEEEEEEEGAEEEEMNMSGSHLTLNSEEPTEWDKMREALEREYNQSLTTLQDQYDCPKSDNFEDYWKPFQNTLVEKLFSDFESLEELYEGGRELYDLYTRQDIVTTEHIKKAHQPFIYPTATMSFVAVSTTEDEEEYGSEEGSETEATESIPQLSTEQMEDSGATEETDTEADSAEADAEGGAVDSEEEGTDE